MSPGLLTGKIKAPPITNPSPTPTAYTNGHVPNGENNNSIIKRGEEIAKTFVNSSDFKKLDSRIEDVVDISHMSSNTKLKTTTTTNTEETLTETKTYQTKPAAKEQEQFYFEVILNSTIRHWIHRGCDQLHRIPFI